MNILTPIHYPMSISNRRNRQFRTIRLQSRVYQNWMRNCCAMHDYETSLEFYSHCYVIPVHRRYKEAK